jgi:fibronectin-binding autotransporter adhesin
VPIIVRPQVIPLKVNAQYLAFDSVVKAAAFAAALLCLAPSLRAQFTYSEDFKNSTAPGWNLYQQEAAPAPRLTSGATPTTGDPETGATIDPSGQGWLRLATATNNQANGAYFDTPIPSAGNKVTITFDATMWGGTADGSGRTGDGLTFFLYDAAQSFTPGARGGSLGYAQMTASVPAEPGLSNAYLGVALDVYGNFSNPTEGRVGGVGLAPNAVVMRGPGNGFGDGLNNNYNYLAGTSGSNGTVGYDYTDTGSATVKDGGDGVVPALPFALASPGATSRPDQTTGYRKVEFTLDENSQATVRMQFGENGQWYTVLSVDMSSFSRPESLRLGFSAGTGGATEVYEVGGLLQVTATAGTGNFFWDNGYGTSVWGTGANDPINWLGNTNPTLKSNVLFNSVYISSPQSIDVTGSDKVVRNMYFSGPNAYTLTTSEARKIIFDNDTTGGITTISLTNDAAGNASHTLGLAVQMNKNLEVINNLDTGHTFTISGAVDNGGNTLTSKGMRRRRFPA